MIVFSVISGAKNEDALCYLLEVDDEVRILLDCGWNDEFNVDALLLSHPDLSHLGAYPYAYGHFGLSCPVYATLPVVNMGRMCMYDVFQSKVNEAEFNTFALDTVDAAFERINTLKYSQPTSLGGKCKGITITAYAAGHSIGGTIWKIKKDTEEIVYAVDYNHKKESRPSLMITDAYNSLIIHPARKHRDAALFDSSARVLELAYLLDQHWAFYQVSYPLVLLTHQSYRTIQYAKSMLEWMSDAINRQYLRLCHRHKDLAKYPGPKVVLASNVSLETGFARELLLEWGTSESNALILTDRGPPNSLARKLYYEWDKIIPLEGIELLEYKSEQRKKHEREATQAALIAKSKSIIEDDETDESESEVGDTDIEELLSTQFDLYVRDATKYGGFFKQTQSYLMFPYTEKRKRYDDYGEIIQVDQFAKRIADGIRDDDDLNGGDKAEISSDRDETEKEDPTNSSSDSNVPTKYISYNQDIKFICKIRFIDLEGTNDGRSLKTIVPQVQPRKLVSN
ncbi:4063_t:CDS:2, partial [Diversispora eburnea]